MTVAEVVAVVGTGPDCNIRITDDEYVSAHHAVVLVDWAGQVWVRDAWSTNGTRIVRAGMPLPAHRWAASLSGEAVPGHEPVRLYPGDTLIVGRTYIPWTRSS